MIGRIGALAALALFAVSITTVYNVRSSAGNPGDVPVAIAPPPPPIGDPGGGSGSPDSAPPARGGLPDNPKAVQPGPPTSIGRTPPVSVNQVVGTYQRDSAFAGEVFKGRQVEVGIADSAHVTFSRRADRAFVQTNSRGSRKVFCQVRGFQTDRIVVSNCVLE